MLSAVRCWLGRSVPVFAVATREPVCGSIHGRSCRVEPPIKLQYQRYHDGPWTSAANGWHTEGISSADAVSATADGLGRGLHSPPDQLEDNIFDIFSDQQSTLPVEKLLQTLREAGLRASDPRLAELFASLSAVFREREQAGSTDAAARSAHSQLLDRPNFHRVVRDNIDLVARAVCQRFVIPEFDAFCRDVDRIFYQCQSSLSGQVASYIPQLAGYDPNYWGVSLCTVDGQRHSAGDCHVSYTMQSISKPLTYGLVLEQLGAELVHRYVGQEPSGRIYNALVLDHNCRPHNPMINAGAIVVCGLLHSLIDRELNGAERFDHLRKYFSSLCGGEYVGFNNAVYLSEREAADRNYALGFYMRENKCFPEKANLSEIMDLYFQSCAMESTCDVMAVMAGSLANGGVCPLSERRVLGAAPVRNVLSLMHSCGMYDYSGQFAFTVGLPAKSGVSGGLMLVVPNVLGLCLWSPSLDMYGNSVRGVQFCQEFVKTFNFHRYDNLRYSFDKKDPRHHSRETEAVHIVSLLLAAARGDINTLRRHRMSGVNMGACDYDGRTPLHVAASENRADVVAFLLQQCSVPVAPQDRWRHTPRHNAQRCGHSAIVSLIDSHLENQQS